jgi:hypothetical protein
LVKKTGAESNNQSAATTPIEQQRKSTLKDLKKKYGLGPADTSALGGDMGDSGGGSSRYIDRADERRRVHGVDPLNAKPEMASLDTAIRQENRGYGLLQKMGWQAGSGLGRHGQGQTEPVPVEMRPALAGLGAENGKDQPAAVPLSQQEKRKNEIWKKTRKRFKAGLWIRIDLTDPDPAFLLNPDPEQDPDPS